MKYIKKFENNNIKFKVGDYVVGVVPSYVTSIRNFLENNVGVILSIEHEKYNDYRYNNVKFFNVPDEHSNLFFIDIKHNGYIPLDDNQIRLATSEEIEEFELKNDINKYNL